MVRDILEIRRIIQPSKKLLRTASWII